MNSTEEPDGALIAGTNASTAITANGFHYQCQMFDFIIESVLMGLLCVFGFVGNAFSFIVLRRHKSKSPTPTLFIALAVADTVFLVTVLLLRVVPSIFVYIGWHAPFAVYAYIGIYVWPGALMAETATIWLTVLVTINRYISVCRPLQAATLCSKRTAYRHVAGVMIFAVLYNVPRFFEYHIQKLTIPNATGQSNQTQIISALTDMGKDRIYRILYGNVLYFLIIYIIPLLTLAIFNTKLIFLLRRSRRERGELLATGGGSRNGVGSGVDSGNKQEQDITVMLIGVVLVFIVCKTPALLTHLLLTLLTQQQSACPSFYFYYSRVSDTMVVTNSSTNFIVYCFCSRKFRHILSQVLCRRKRSFATENGSKTFSTYTQVHDISSDSQSSRRCKYNIREKGV